MPNKLFFLGVISLLLFITGCSQIVNEDNISDKQVLLVAPQDNSQFNSTSVALNWQPVEFAKKYKVQIAKPDFVNPMQILVDTEVTTTSYTAQLGVGTYQWRVQAISGATFTPFATRTITILSNQNFQDNIVVLSTPVTNFATNVTAQTFTWQTVAGATNYQFQLVDSATTLVYNQTTANTSLNYTLPQGTYTWKVRATNGTDFTLYTANSIIIDTTAPNIPSLTAPVNNTTTTTANVSFQWTRTAISGSTEYDQINIYKDAALTNLHLQTQASSSYTTTLPVGTYYWFVKSYDQAGNQSARSSVNTLTIN